MKIKIGGIVDQQNLTMYGITSLKDKPGSAAEILNLLAQEGINLEYITEGGCKKDSAIMIFCVDAEWASKVDEIIHKNIEKNAQKIRKCENVCVLGVYGPHFREKPAIAAHFCAALGKAEVNILGLSSSISTISAIIDIRDHEKAIKSIMNIFELPNN